MKLVVDTREQDPLFFVATEGVEVVRECLPVGDYSAYHDGILDKAVIERKSIADLFGSFTGKNYERERKKIFRAQHLDLKYIIAIEGSALEVRKGHSYWNGEERVESAKSGISMVRQMMTITRKYGVEVWWCANREDMAFRIMEYFLQPER